MVNKVFKPCTNEGGTIVAEIGKEDVLRISNERDLKFVRLWIADILGFFKNFPIAVRKSKEAVADFGLINPESRI